MVSAALGLAKLMADEAAAYTVALNGERCASSAAVFYSEQVA